MKNNVEENFDSLTRQPQQIEYSMSSDFYSSLERQYNRARDKLHAQTKATEKKKQAYHKAMFNVEKKAIKAELALTLDVVTSAEKELRDLIKKATVLKDKYMSHIIEWRSKFAVLLELTNEMTRARAREEAVCLDYTLSTLQHKAESAPSIIRDSDALKGVDAAVEKVHVLTEKICTPVFEEYVPAGKKNEMFQVALGDMAGTKKGPDFDSSATKGENGDKTGFTKDEEGGQKLSTQWKSHINAVIKEYTKQNFDELNLHTGEQVIQMLPADNSGMAFGVKKNGLLRKKKGFFPVSHVQENGILANTRDDSTGRTKRNSNNPVLRILDAITEPKTKISLLQEIASDDGAKVFDDKLKPKKLLCKKTWLRTIYGIDISDDEIYTIAKKDDDLHTPTKMQCARNMSPERCVFSKMSEPVKITLNNGVSKHKDLVLEDIECTDGDIKMHTGTTNTHFKF